MLTCSKGLQTVLYIINIVTLYVAFNNVVTRFPCTYRGNVCYNCLFVIIASILFMRLIKLLLPVIIDNDDGDGDGDTIPYG